MEGGEDAGREGGFGEEETEADGGLCWNSWIDPTAFLMPTMGFDKDVVKKDNFTVLLYGLGGAETIRGYWSKYYDEVSCELPEDDSEIVLLN